MSEVSAPIFVFSGKSSLSSHDSHLRNGTQQGSFTLAGPGATAEAGHLPVRGDLAHIALAGRYFVPHYAVPMPHDVIAQVWLRRAAKLDSEEICALPAGTSFDVLDISGNWAWGQYGENGPVGYVPLGNLQAP